MLMASLPGMSQTAMTMTDSPDPFTELLSNARTQQQIVEESLLRLHSHTAGLDAVVREEIHRTFVEECGALVEEARRVTDTLAHLQGVARSYLGWSGVVSTVLSIVAAMWIVNQRLPSRTEQAGLRQEEVRLKDSVTQLARLGGRVALRRCGPSGRICAQVDLKAPTYGAAGDFYVLKGY